MVAQVQWGDVATWLVAAFTGTAAVFAVRAYYSTQSLIALQRREAQAEKAEVLAQKEKEQARLVSAWPGELGPQTDDAFSTLHFSYQNRSDEPVYLMEVGTPNRTRADLKPIWKSVGTVAPGFQGEGVLGLPLKPEFNHTGADEGVVSRFCDAAGRWWFRDRDGGLSKLIGDPREKRLPTPQELRAMVVETDHPPLLQ